MQDLLKLSPLPWEEREVVHEVGPYTIERVRTQWDYELEGYLLAHCLGTKNAETFGRHHTVFSVRDKETGIPHCTILCIRKGKRSPYGGSADFGTRSAMLLDGKKLRILQVRGRFDYFARPEYVSIVFKWFQSLGGKPKYSLNALTGYSAEHGDDDEEYHFDYWLDEDDNDFTWSYRAVEKAREARKAGTSL